MLSHSLIDSAYTRLAADVGRLRVALERSTWSSHLRGVEQALDQLGDAIDWAPVDPALERLVRNSFMSVLSLAQLLAGAHSPDPATSTALDEARRAIHRQLDSLEPYVSRQDRETRRVLLGGESLDSALQRMFCG